MKRTGLFLVALFFLVLGCKDKTVSKPKNLIARETMVDIICDLSILEAAKTQTMGASTKYMKPAEFLKKKYKIDSITFAESTKYYAADVPEFKNMYDEAKARLDAETLKLNGGKPVVPNPNEGIVK